MNKERHVLRERDLLLKLKHFNIIKVLSVFKDEQNLYFVFENAQNGTVDQLITKFKNKLGENLVKHLFA